MVFIAVIFTHVTSHHFLTPRGAEELLEQRASGSPSRGRCPARWPHPRCSEEACSSPRLRGDAEVSV